MIPIISPIVAFLVVRYPSLLLFPIITAFAAERHYVGRVSLVSNTMSMIVAIAPRWSQTASWLNFYGLPLFHYYLVLGLVFGTVAFLSYIARVRVEGTFYTVGWVLFNSVIAGIVCLLAALLF
jgi:hypothetical protein